VVVFGDGVPGVPRAATASVMVFGCDKRETRACASSGARAHSSRGGRWYVALRGLEGRRGRRFPRFTALVRG